WTPYPLSPEEVQNIRQRRYKLLKDYRRQHAYAQTLKGQPGDTADVARKYEAAAMNCYIASHIMFWRTFPIYDLPLEILSNIIHYVVWSAPSPRVGIRWRLQLTWVSRYLRHAAISDPTLWNAIWFQDDPPFERSLAFVERSRTSPLDLRINDTPTHKLTDQEIRAVLKVLTPCLHHIRILVILLENWEPILSVLKWLSNHGKESIRPLTMERFEIHRTGNPYQWPGVVLQGTRFDPVNHSVFLYSLFGGRDVPELKSFTMNGINIDWANSPSLNNLTTLDLRRIPLILCPPLSRFRQILASSPMLAKLSLDGAGPASNPITINNHSTIDLPHLHTLVLANFAAAFPKYIVSHFTAPNVKDLTIMNFNGFDYGPFFEFMIGRFPKITLLTLTSTSCPTNVLPMMIKWLDSMPLLAYARLDDLEQDILQAFLFDPDTMEVHPDLPPALRSAPCLNILKVQAIRPDVFVNFILARKACGVPVKKTYMAQSMANKFSDGVFADISRDISSLTCMDIDASTPEEKGL
ncbi:hypothetical protein F5878DRAFT_681987, partial [Lentinula raphanica]